MPGIIGHAENVCPIVATLLEISPSEMNWKEMISSFVVSKHQAHKLHQYHLYQLHLDNYIGAVTSDIPSVPPVCMYVLGLLKASPKHIIQISNQK